MVNISLSVVNNKNHDSFKSMFIRITLNVQDLAEFNAATSTIAALRPAAGRSPAASPRHSPRAPRRPPPENAYGELRAPPLPPRKSLSPAERAATSEQDLVASVAQEPKRRSSLEPEPDSRHRLTSVITGSTETITGVIDTRHEIPPDPRAFEKPRRACTPQSNSRPLPATPPEKQPEERHNDVRNDRADRNERPAERVAERNERVAERNERATDRNERVTDRNERVTERNERVAERNDRVTDRNSNITERPERPEKLDRHIPDTRQLERHQDRSFENRIERHVSISPETRQNNDRHKDFRHPPERPPDKPVINDRASFDRDFRDNKAPPRQRSLPSSTSGSIDHPTKSTTMPKFPSEDVRDPPYENVVSDKNELALAPKKINPLTHDKHGRKYAENVSYENINLDYIARLVEEGYPKDIVVRALGITRNDLEMACDILHEFGAKIPNKC